METEMETEYDVVVIGGGSAGLSGAVALARSRRSVLLLDAGDPRNAPAEHVHNFLTRDGTPPSELAQIGRDEVARYGGHVVPARAEAVRRDGERFVVEMGDSSVRARRLLVATGTRDHLPDVPGLADRWGIDVLHCPYCHGFEVRDQRIGVLSTGPMTVHQALLFGQLSPWVTVLEHDGPALTPDQQEQLAAVGITIVQGTVARVDTGAAGLDGVRLDDGRQISLDALVVAPQVTARAELLAPLDLKPVDVLVGDHVIGTRIEADSTGATAVPGVFVAGNVADVQAQVVTSAGAGLMVGAAINADMIAEENQAAVDTYRYERVFGERASADR